MAQNPDPDAGRRAAYWQQLKDRLAAERADRKQRLDGQATAVRQATDLYRRFGAGEAGNVAIQLRRPFVALPQPTADGPDGGPADADAPEADHSAQSGRPPLSRLIFRRSRSLPLYLTCLYVAHLEFPAGRQVLNEHAINGRRSDRRPESWAQLAGMAGGGTNRARRARVLRALDQLEAAGLVTLSTRSDRYEQFELLKEDGGGQRYLVPGADAGDCLVLPHSFFYFGWHLVLEPTEIATYLALWDATIRHGASARRRGQQGIALAETVRRAVYGLSDEAYESIHDLEEFGLIRIYDPMPGRRFGRFSRPDTPPSPDGGQFRPLPYQISLVNGLDRDAHQAVSVALAANSIPPRLTEGYELARMIGRTTSYGR